MVRGMGIFLGLLYNWVVPGVDKVLAVDEVLGVEGSCCWGWEGKIGMVTKGWGVGGVGIGFGSSGLAGGSRAVDAKGSGSGSTCCKIFLSSCF